MRQLFYILPLAAFLVIGGYLAWVFRPGVPVAYDPEQLIERFEKSEADAAAKAPDI